MNKGNLNAQQSKEDMRQAMLELLTEKAFDKITIQDITKKANLSRRTFYRNYQQKNDIITEILTTIWQDFLAVVKKTDQRDLSVLSEAIFSVALEHKEVILLLHQHQLFTHIIPLAMEDFPDMVVLPDPEIAVDENTLLYLVTFFASGFFHIIPEYLVNEPYLPPEVMGQYLEGMFLIYKPTLED